MRTLIERYLNGEDGKSVYADICNLKQGAFSNEHFDDVIAVLTETFERVAYNLNLIQQELATIGYCFKTEFNSNSDKPLVAPLPGTDKLLTLLDTAVAEFGKVPLSLKMFYKAVAGCNFAWDYESSPDLLWDEADPIQIASLDDLVEYVSSDDWKDYMNDCLEIYNEPALELAADYLHKDNISGGAAYSLQLTGEDCVDAIFLNEPNGTNFIGYLRVCMESCGFPGRGKFRQEQRFTNFCAKVSPLLKRI
ncbi:hypothetical protein [Mucilaginibacter gilvus]|uniref:Uncharacterized protein n=1 Tax=Mucilaginibacter gilvus TaxID=2305909 RepID=A0A444MM09_9SPHI|nr:hypothetical protein [Mucilaginibacter gilvus]RWY50283.1 hypothetical protein EPL05_16165 [Mucilaginibacter gilvus]